MIILELCLTIFDKRVTRLSTDCSADTGKYLNGEDCVAFCPTDTFLQEDGKTCKATCEKKIYETVVIDATHSHNVCLENTDSCKDTATKSFHIDTADVNYTQCLDTCPTGKYLNGEDCVAFCPTDTFLQEDGKTCGASCAAGFYVVVDQQKTCVTECAEPYIK